ncbi:putative LRR receptor-like serine/threonine-protein kinase [Heracleum sosnowskyi]|uniref:LRR receptor-like serine/threonine-protein kinase n=1 Tax=Heracleum sosnowskyi TaxID=360622 RepID=A0AAD8MG03_9APIA|nr:putative LRR receptor-like serine/threonine-protein kinase [Heracleum sosnowskyi]
MAHAGSPKSGKGSPGDCCLGVRCNHIPAAYIDWHLHLKQVVSLLILFFLLNRTNSYNSPNIEGEALVQILKSLNDSNHRIIDWNLFFVKPCPSWSHVTCRDEHVIYLSLASNGFSGTLSPLITKLKFLVSLDLEDNNLSGELPDFLGSMPQLQNLKFARNGFNGSIPSSWGQLSNLKHLDLSSNNLTGRIPVPLFSVPVFNFSGTHLACGSSLQEPCVSGTSIPGSTRKSKLKAVITGVTSGAFVLLLLGAIFMYRSYQVRRSKHDVYVDVEGEYECKLSFGQLRRFSWREIQLATDNFNENNIIGQGGFGKVYKGLLLDGTRVAVKRLNDYQSPGGEEAFLREIDLISVAVHKNLLRLIGFYTTSVERILIYPFMRNISVAYQLRDLKPGEKGLDWQTRKRIASVRGTMGHIAPEYLSTGKSSEKTDVFGYGITLLELVTGQRAIDFSRLEEEEDVLLLDHIKKLLREKRLAYIVDEHMKIDDPTEVETVIQIALLCTQSSPEDRPTMSEVVGMLQGDVLTDRWAEWEQQEEVRNQECSLLSYQYIWSEETTQDQEAIQLSQAR